MSGDDEQPAVAMHHCVDMEQHARSFNEGYEAAVAQGLADDPTLAGDWLDEHDRQVKVAVLAEAEARILRHRQWLMDSETEVYPEGSSALAVSRAWDNCGRADAEIVAILRSEVAS